MIYDFKFGPRRIDIKFLVLITSIDSGIVFINHVLAFLAVRLNDKVLHFLNSLIYRNNLGDTEECRLENRVGTVTQTYLLCYLRCVNIIHFYIIVRKVFLHFIRQVLNQFVSFPNGIEQECSTLLQSTRYVVHLQISLYVASHKIRRSNEIGGVNRLIAETQVRTGEASGFLGVVGEICLAVFVGSIAYDLDGVLICAHGTISTKTIELSLEHTFSTHSDLFAHRQ